MSLTLCDNGERRLASISISAPTHQVLPFFQPKLSFSSPSLDVYMSHTQIGLLTVWNLQSFAFLIQHFKLSIFNLSILVKALQSLHFPITHLKDFASQIAAAIKCHWLTMRHLCHCSRASECMPFWYISHYPAGSYLLKVNSRSRYQIYSKLTLLLTLNIFHILF